MSRQEKIIGREDEMRQLRSCLKSDRSEFIIVYGRRRVGKTFLVDSFFNMEYDFSFVGRHRLSKAKQLRSFAKAMKKYANLQRQPQLTSWDDAFDALEEYLEALPEDKRKVIFIDEMPWIDTPQSEFVEALEMFWNGWAARRSDIVLVASGSSTSWMIDKLVENQGGLHARITRNIYLRPFTLNEVEQYLRMRGAKWDRYQITQLYMMMGGIPFYYTLLDIDDSLMQNIDRLFFAKNGALRVEFDELFHALFTHAEKYIDVVKLLNSTRKGLTRKEISAALNLNGSTLTGILRNLERSDFIQRYSHFGHKSNDAIFRLVDFYTLFYFKFIDGNHSLDEQWWSHNYQTHSVEAWQGFAFELVALLHLPQIKQKLGISGISANASSWRFIPSRDNADEHLKGTQIDLLIDRADRVINLCEMKFSVKPFRITSEYENRLRQRMEIFVTHTKTTKTVLHTFVTTFGVADGKHHSIVDNEVRMEDLFK